MAQRNPEFFHPQEPIRGKRGASIMGPSNPSREAESPDRLAPPKTDHGTLPSLRWSFCDSHNRLSEGGGPARRQSANCQLLPNLPA